MSATPIIYTIRAAEDQDVSAVVGLRIHAEKWLAAAGIEQWTVRATGEENIRAYIDRGTTFVVEDARSEVIASLTLDGGDPAFWTPDELNDEAIYLYKFIVHSNQRGSGLGDALLNWACRRAADQGARYLRLDCWRTNLQLHDYYLRRGFDQVDIREAPGRMSGALFQRRTDLQLTVNADLHLRDATRNDYAGRKGDVMDDKKDRYDPTGEAAIWVAAAQIVSELKRESDQNNDLDPWNSALEQAARSLDMKAREIRWAGGMYYRPLNGIPKED